MTRCPIVWKQCSIIASLWLATCTSLACSQESPKQIASEGDSQLLKQFKMAGKDASVTVLPVRLGNSSMKQVAEVVGLLLERAGMKNVEIGSDEFSPPDDKNVLETASSLGEFVKAHPPTTDYTMFADFLMSPQRRFVEVRGIIVSKDGQVVWQDRQTKDEKDFKRVDPKEPMQCCIHLVERLRPVLGLTDPTKSNSADGKLAERWQKNTGVPDKAELAAMEKRSQVFKKAAAKSTILICPPLAGSEFSNASATNLVSLVNDAKLAKAASTDQGPQIKFKREMNEQKTLWAMARAFRDFVQHQRPDADYILFADYLMGSNSVGAVHFALCNRQGELVFVDYQNNHHDDFKSINPKSRQDCDRLVAKRLAHYCK